MHYPVRGFVTERPQRYGSVGAASRAWSATRTRPTGAPLGDFIAANWQSTHADFVKVGTLKGTEPATAAYTSKFIAACNDFDRDAIVAQAKAMTQ